MADPGHKHWQTLLDRLTAEHRQSLLNFAEYLLSRQPDLAPVELEVADIPRPRSESVIGAIRRLSETYPMLDRAKLFNEASSLMAQHVLQGSKADATIDQLETLFRGRYEDSLKKED